MSKCAHCDAGHKAKTIMLGDVPVPGMHLLPVEHGRQLVNCRNYIHEIPQKALDDAARSPFWSMIKKDPTL